MTKGKLTKKIVALAATVMMLLAIAMPAMAAPNTGQITVHKLAGNTPGTIPNNTGEQVAVPAGYAPLADATFTLYRLNPTEITAMMSLVTSTNIFVSHVVNPGVAPTVTFTLSSTGPYTVNATMHSVQTTSATGEAVFGPNLQDGWYILQETVVPAGYEAAEPSLIRLPMTTSGGNANYDVHVYPKNVSTAGLAVKEIGIPTQPVSNGMVIPFELKARFRNLETVPANKVNSVADLRATPGPSANPADYGDASITEAFNTYFELSGTMVVRWLNAAGEIDITPAGLLTLGTHYTITSTPATPSAGAIYKVSLTPAGIDAAIAQGSSGFGLQVNARYIGQPTAGVGTPDKLENKMEVNMQAAGGAPTIIIVDDTTYIPSISIQVDKVKQADGTPLAGVTFELATVPNPTVSTDYVEGAGGVRLSATTDATGQIYFAHLPDYNETSGITYYLKEVSTAPGYQVKVGTVAVTFRGKMAYLADPTTPTTWFDGMEWSSTAQVVETATVTNALLTEPPIDEPGFSLPLTGGAGTVIFTAVGIVVMLGAAIVYLQGKKRNI